MFAFVGERPRKQDAVRGARLTIEIGADFAIGPTLGLGAAVRGLELRRLACSYLLRASLSKQMETTHRGLEATSCRRAQEIEKLAQESDELRRLNHDPDEAEFDISPGHWMNLLTVLREAAEDSRRRADHYAALKQKYERAALFPWLTIEPDPPEPE